MSDDHEHKTVYIDSVDASTKIATFGGKAPVDSVDSVEKATKPPTDSEEKATKPPTDSEEKATEPPTDSEEKATEPIADSEEKATKPPTDSEEKATEPPTDSETDSDSNDDDTRKKNNENDTGEVEYIGDDDDDMSQCSRSSSIATKHILEVDPLYFRLTCFLKSKNGNFTADLLETISSQLKRLNDNLEKQQSE